MVRYFRIPLDHRFCKQIEISLRIVATPTFESTLSNDGGLTREKHTKKTSVCGYERGRRRS